MIKGVTLCIVLLSELLGATSVAAQSADGARIFFDALCFAGPTSDSVRLDLFLAVPSGITSFERTGQSFVATYRVHFEVNAGARRVFDTAFVHRISTLSPEVASANRPSFDFYQHSLFVEPGSYEARVEIIDPRTTFVTNARRTINVVDYSLHQFALSGLLLVERIREDSSGFVITPRLSEQVTDGADGFFVFFESYNGGAAIDVRLDARYRGEKVTVDSRTFERAIPSGRTQHWLRLDADNLAPASYILELQARRADDTAKVIATTQRSIRLEAGAAAMPVAEGELDERIAQLRYVALQSEIDAIRDGGLLAEKRTRFADFWRRLDPSPGTAENEAMREYFSRIDHAQEHYRSYSPGWMTDQGRVYVVYGPPDNVLRDPFLNDSRRVETWQYYSRGNLQVVFHDDSGFGDYRLVTPISHLEKYRYEH